MIDFFERGKIENKFLIIAFIVGILIIIITPPMCMPDENAHYINAYTISRGDFFAEVRDEGKQIGKELNINVYNFVINTKDRFTGKIDEKFKFSELYFDSWLTNDAKEDIFYNTPLNLLYHIGYIFSAFGMFICRIFLRSYATPYNLLIAGRLFNLLYYVITFFCAIKISPVLKNTMTILAMLPMSIYLGASCSYDAVLIPSVALFFSIFIKIILSDDTYIISKKDIFIVLCSIFFIVGIKKAYAPLLLILLFIPIRKFENKKIYIFCIVISILVGLVACLPEFVNNIIKSGYLDGNSIYYEQQKEYVVNNYTDIPNIFLKTLKSYQIFYLITFFGNLGNLDTNFPAPIIVLGYILLAISTVLEISIFNKKIDLKIKFSILILSLFSMLGIFLAMYIMWTPLPGIGTIGMDTITGVQGRYFIPVYLFFASTLSNSFFKKNNTKLNDLTYFIAYIFMCVYSVLTIFILFARFWI